MSFIPRTQGERLLSPIFRTPEQTPQHIRMLAPRRHELESNQLEPKNPGGPGGAEREGRGEVPERRRRRRRQPKRERIETDRSRREQAEASTGKPIRSQSNLEQSRPQPNEGETAKTAQQARESPPPSPANALCFERTARRREPPHDASHREKPMFGRSRFSAVFYSPRGKR